MLFMSKASVKHEFHEKLLLYHRGSQGPQTSAPPPQMWWALGQWPICPTGKSGAVQVLV